MRLVHQPLTQQIQEMSHKVISQRPFLESFGRKSKTEAVCLKKERKKKKSPAPTVTFVSQREGGWLWNRRVQGGALFICHALPLQPGVKSTKFAWGGGGNCPAIPP